jgi:hypothetical protein
MTDFEGSPPNYAMQRSALVVMPLAIEQAGFQLRSGQAARRLRAAADRGH